MPSIHGFHLLSGHPVDNNGWVELKQTVEEGLGKALGYLIQADDGLPSWSLLQHLLVCYLRLCLFKICFISISPASSVFSSGHVEVKTQVNTGIFHKINMGLGPYNVAQSLFCQSTCTKAAQ